MIAPSLPGDDGRFAAAIAEIDAVNAEDPSREPQGGEPGAPLAPSALLYGQRMSGWLLRLAPDAPEELRLAARAQHIARWRIPRKEFPDGRDGYLAWRVALARFHAETAGEIMARLGYDRGAIDRVADLLQKKRLKRDSDVQTLEDAACLVFLETQFAAFAAKHPDDKVIGILRKTAAKMSAAGLVEAGKLVERLPAAARALVAAALG